MDNIGAVLVIEDKKDIPATWNTMYSIQRLSEANVWYDIKSNKTVQFLMKMAFCDENGITEIPLDWEGTYGKLEKGIYKIVKNKNFTTLYSESFEIK